ncbi:MAG: TIGR01777 family protein [Candidatus Electrothrix sp. AR4]|nr:TIGR01777 family protein [Candidatus Electrothrix sp. AR4]
MVDNAQQGDHLKSITIQKNIERNAMKILVSGASGLVGRAVVRSLSAKGHQVLSLRRKSTQAPYWDIDRKISELGSEKDIDVIIHLAGESVAEGRWTSARKERIFQSRVQGTQLLSEFFSAAAYTPKLMISASAVGFYGERGDEELNETSEKGVGFLSDVAEAWEEACKPATVAGIRVANIRFGMVLSTEGGGLAKMLPPFKLGLGGTIGDGRQYMSWISIYDAVDIIDYIIHKESLRGAINLVAPDSVTNRRFTKILGKVLRRPALIPVPKFLLSFFFGEMARELLFSSAKVHPDKLIRSGYSFLEPDIETAFRNLLD